MKHTQTVGKTQQKFNINVGGTTILLKV